MAHSGVNFEQNFVIGREPDILINRVGDKVQAWHFPNGTPTRLWGEGGFSVNWASNDLLLFRDDAILYKEGNKVIEKWYRKNDVYEFPHSETWMKDNVYWVTKVALVANRI